MTRRRPLAIPAIIAAGIRRAEKERRANVIARPMRNLMDMLRQGEVFELDGRAVQRLPKIDEQFATRAEWVEIAPAIRGWIDCWKRLAPRLVEQARDEFDATVARLADIPPGQVTSAIRTTEIAWEIEKLQRGEAA